MSDVEKLNFTSIQHSDEFKGYENDLDKYAPHRKASKEFINEYGVRVRTKSEADPNYDDGDEAVVFSANIG